jgi:hypothetical protein
LWAASGRGTVIAAGRSIRTLDSAMNEHRKGPAADRRIKAIFNRAVAIHFFLWVISIVIAVVSRNVIVEVAFFIIGAIFAVRTFQKMRTEGERIRVSYEEKDDRA